MKVHIGRSLIALLLVTGVGANAALAQDQTQSGSAATTGQAASATQSPSSQPTAPTARGWWEPGAGFDIDSHSTGYGWFGPQYQRYLSDNVRLTAKATVNYLFYEYESSLGRTKVSGPGVNTRVGLKFGDTNWVHVGAGPSFKRRNTTFRFADGSEADGNGEWRTGMTVGGDVWLAPTSRTNVMGQAQFDTEDNFFWTRLMGRRQISNFGDTGGIRHFVGAEAIGMGNEDFGSVQLGGLFEFMHVPSSASIQLRAGWKQQNFELGDDKSGPYFGIGYWQRLR